MALDRWDPWRDMLTVRDAMERMFQESWLNPSGGARSRDSIPLDIADQDNQYVVHATLPGVRPEDVQITVHGNTLSIRGEQSDSEERRDQNWIMRERRGASFYRAITLPTAVNTELAKAEYENGVLTLTLPKLEQARATKIKITSKQTNQSVPVTDEARVAGQTMLPPTDTGERHPTDRVTRSSEESFPASDSPAWQ